MNKKNTCDNTYLSLLTISGNDNLSPSLFKLLVTTNTSRVEQFKLSTTSHLLLSRLVLTRMVLANNKCIEMIVPGDNYLRLCPLMMLHIVKNYALVTSMTSGMHFLHYIMLGVIILPPQQTGDVYPTSVESWPTVCDAGPAFTQSWANVSCLQSHPSLYRIETDW